MSRNANPVDITALLLCILQCHEAQKKASASAPKSKCAGSAESASAVDLPSLLLCILQCHLAQQTPKQESTESDCGCSNTSKSRNAAAPVDIAALLLCILQCHEAQKKTKQSANKASGCGCNQSSVNADAVDLPSLLLCILQCHLAQQSPKDQPKQSGCGCSGTAHAETHEPKTSHEGMSEEHSRSDVSHEGTATPLENARGQVEGNAGAESLGVFNLVSDSVTFGYDTRGRLSTATFANGTVVTYNYDAAGNRTSVVTTCSGTC